MKKIKLKNHTKQLISILLSLCMLMTFLPIIAMPASAAQSELPSSAAAILEQDETAPADFNSTQDPYGLVGTNDSVTLRTFNELNFSVSNQQSLKSINYDTYKKKDNTDFSMDEKYFESSQFYEYWAQKANYRDVRYIQTDAADLNGDGTKESVVHVGLLNNQKVVTWFINEETGMVSDMVVVQDDTVDWLNDISGQNKNYQTLNFISIAAGDFNGDGVDTWFVYFPGGGNKYAIYEFKQKNTNADEKGIVRVSPPENYSAKDDKRQSYIHRSYIEKNDMGIQGSNHYQDGLSADLTVGDFNGDGYDDLAIISYTNDTSSDYEDSLSFELYTPFLAIGYGYAKGLPTTSNVAIYVDDAFEDAKRHISIAPSLSSGDIDNDGYDEIVVAGYYGETRHNGDEWNMNDGERSAKYINTFTIQANNKSDVSSQFQRLDANDWLKGKDVTGVNLDNDWVWQPMAVRCGALDGPFNAESVFIGGSVCKWNASTGFMCEHTPEYFKSADKGAGGWSISVTYIPSVVAGVFDGNCEGKEQFAYSVGLKQYITASNYKFTAGIIGTQDNTYYDSNPENNEYTTFTGTDGTMVLTAVDRDNDVMRIRYSNKNCIWEDPSVVTVLQAAPYFGELGTYNDNFDSGSTNYEYSVSYEEANGTCHSHSVGAGGKFEVEVGEVFELEIKAGYSGEWSSESVQLQGKEITYSIAAGPYDTVILQRTPMYEYNYDVYKPSTKTWEKASYSVWISGTSMLYSLSIDEYNAFVDAYNETMKNVKNFAKFEKLTKENAKSLFGNEGNPYAYDADMKDVLGTAVMPLSHNAGWSAISFAKSYGDETTNSEEHGFSVEFELAVGIGSSPCKLGLYGSTEHKWGTTKTVSNTNTTTTAGTVAGIDDTAIMAELGIPKSTIREYGFNWTFGTWDVNLGGKGKVPVYGYNTSSVTSPTPKVTDLSYEITDDGKAIDFSWSKPQMNDNSNIDGYYFYIAEDDGTLTKYNKEIITDTTFTLKDFDRTKGYTFAVTAAQKKNMSDNEHFYYSESIFSNQCIYNGDLSGKSAYEIALENGYEGTEKEWLDSLIGTDGIDGVSIDKVELDKSGSLIVYFTNGTNTNLGNIIGPAGKDGASISKVAINEKGELVVTLTDGSTVNAGVVVGKDGREVEFRTTSTYIQWKYVGEVDTQWRNLVSLESLKGAMGNTGATGNDGVDGREVDIQVADGLIQWRYKTGSDTAWKDMISLDSLVGATGATGAAGQNAKEIEVRKSNSFVQWRYVGDDDTAWKNLFSLDEIKGADGKDGTNGTDGVNGKDGAKGENGTNGTDGINGTNATNGKDATNSTNGKDGVNGTDGIEGIDGKTPYIGENGNWWIGDTDTGKIAVAVSVSEISVDENGQLVFIMSDGSTKNAKMPNGSVAVMASENSNKSKDNVTTRKIATTGVAVSSASLLWNIITLVVAFIRKRKSGFLG